MRSPARKHIGALPRCTHMEENGGAILEKSDLKVNDHSVFFFHHQRLYRRGTNYVLSIRTNPLDKSCGYSGEKDFYGFIMVHMIVISSPFDCVEAPL